MKILERGLCLALLGAGLAAVPATLAASASATPSRAAVDQRLVSDLREQAQGSVSIRKNPATGEAGLIRAGGGGGADLLPAVAGDGKGRAVAKADAFVDRFGGALGAAPGQLVRQAVDTTDSGWTVRYTQVHDGVPVFGSLVKVNLDPQGDLTSVAGFAAPDAEVPTDAGTSAEEAEEIALAFVRQDPPTSTETGRPADTSGTEASSELFVYRTGFLQGRVGQSVLAHVVEVTNGANIRDQVVIDAQTGKLLNRWSMVNHALDRELYEASGTEEDVDLTLVWEEGQPLDALNQDQRNLVESAGESYWLFENAFDRDSYDGEGATMTTVNNDPRIECPNANWNGITTNYCNGVTSDDVVSHEWGHAYTEYTSGLIYQYQSGALNESFSDVWGETLDLINAREDEGEGDITAKRPDGGCDPTAPPVLEMEITAPAGVAGPCTAVAATGAEPFTTSTVTAEVLVATDAADTAGPSTTDGCSAFTDAAGTFTGKWAYVDRGSCNFSVKVANAEAAGATGIVIGNNNSDVPGGFIGDPDLYGVMVSQADGARFKSAGGAVTVEVTADDVSTRTVSTRWLMGEKSEAFGGSIRDMWTPTCYGDPGKVSDVEYKCDPTMDDAGGVHSNSGVPNHAYALAVDGGSYNGQTITGMGLDKAAAIWWRAQTAYLTPSSNFTDAANGLEASCADLVGDPIRTLSTQPDAPVVPAAPVTAADCAELAEVLTAVEMRTAPTACDFQPLLDKDTPALCGPGFTTEAIWSEDFEDGLTGWTPSFELFTYSGQPYGGIHEPWQARTDAPGGHAGGVAYGPAPDEGQCTGDGETDFSSRDSIAGPVVELPTGQLRTLRLSFEHYVATEAIYDGGNVKMSVNGGGFTTIPAAAYTFNGPGQLATLGQGNSNPMAGEDAFTGTDGGETRGSWGTSHVDLAAAGAEPGDTVQFRLDIGRDGCGGADGWYVDDIALTVCKAVATVAAQHVPEPVAAGTESQVVVQVRRGAQTVGSAPSGVVVLRDPSGANVGEATLNTDGDATFTLPATLPAGTHTYTVQYRGSETFAAASTTVTVTVTGSAAQVSSTVTAKAEPRRIRRGQAFDVRVAVTAPGTTPTGTVEIHRGKKLLGSAILRADGTVRVDVSGKMARKLKEGKNTLTATYLGSATVSSSQDDFTVVVKRRR